MVCQSSWCCLWMAKEIYTGIGHNGGHLFIVFFLLDLKMQQFVYSISLPYLMWVARPLCLKRQLGAGLAWPLHYYPGVSRGAWAWTFTGRGAGQGTGLCEQLCPVLDLRTQLPLTLWRSLSLHTFTHAAHISRVRLGYDCKMKSSNA